MANQHIVEITIIWPDDKWEQADENRYLESCLIGIAEHFEAHPIRNTEERRTISNPLGRVYAEVHISPSKAGPVETNKHLNRGGA